MKLILLQNPDGAFLEICKVPRADLSSMGRLRALLHLHGCRLFGVEGKDFRICQAPRGSLVPLTVNQIVVDAQGRADYGQQLVIQ